MEYVKTTWRSVIVGLLFTIVFAMFTVYLENRLNLIVTATQIAVLPFVLLMACVLLLNPICRLIRIIKPFTKSEILLIFVMTSISAGISTFGMASQLVPLMGGMFNQHWNNDQTEWDRYVAPFVNDAYFVSEDGIQEAALAYHDALLATEKARNEGENEATVAALETEQAARKAALEVLEEKAFAHVELFRRGLPRGDRAFPGFVKLPDESWGIYRARLGRLMHGRPALKAVQEAKALGKEGDYSASKEQVVTLVDSAIERLERMGATVELEAEGKALGKQWNTVNEQSIAIDKLIQEKSDEGRLADPATRERLEDEVLDLRKELRKLNLRKRDLTQTQETVKKELETLAKIGVAIDQLEVVKARVQDSASFSQAEVGEPLDAALALFPKFDTTLKRYVVGDVPWGVWLRPLALWSLVLVLSYTVLMTFNMLIFRQWAHNERLIFPLAQLPEILAGAEGGADGENESGFKMPKIFSNGLFWVGVSISGGVMGWNLLASSGWVPGLPHIRIKMGLEYWTSGSIFEPTQPGAEVSVFFTMIGLAFLIPAEISFSLWFFWVMYMVQLLVVVWSGHGVNEGSFRGNWYETLNFRTSEAFGALMVFSMVVLWKCRRFLFCGFYKSDLGDLQADERFELKLSSILFCAGSVGLILVLWLSMGANLWYSIIVYLVILMITIGLVRAVAEGGVLGFQAWVSPFHFIRTVFGMDKAWTAPSLFAPLLIFYSVLFLDIKTFIAPAMANSLKLRDDLRMRRLGFHSSVVLALVAAIAFSLIMHIILAYSKGADSMQNWFYSSFPKSLFGTIASWSKTLPVDSTANPWWLVFGAALMGGLLLARGFVFWLPHPIGLIMLVNPIMHKYWTSILIGWLAKKMVTKYGNKETYGAVRGLFIGLIAGELSIVVLSAVVSFITENHLGISLNR